MSVKRNGVITIFWGRHSPSTDAFAERLDAKPFNISFSNWSHPLLAPIKYVPMWFKTWQVLLQERPSAILVVNTPVFAPLCVYIYSLFTKTPFVMNIHGHSFIGRKWGWARPLQKFLAKRAVANLVGFTEYEELFTSWGTKAIKLERPPFLAPVLNGNKPAKSERFSVTMISTFKKDEPLDLVIDAAKKLPEVDFYILGDTKLADKQLLESASSNVYFPGYLTSADYWERLNASDLLITLTTTPKSLVSGGIEAMSLGKPMMLSAQPVLIDYFTKGTVFVEHNVESIVQGIDQARLELDKLALESKTLLIEKQSRWQESFVELQRSLTP